MTNKKPAIAGRHRMRRVCSHCLAPPAVCLFATLAAGCADTRGPELVVNSHIEYNKAVSQVLKEELLLNVVRRRYMEAPQFLNVSSISTNLSTTTGLGAGVSVGDIGDGNIVDGSVDGSLTFSDSPTVTITPRQGEDIASQLHEPASVSTVADLVAAGYPVDGVLRMVVEGINNLQGPDLRFDGFRPEAADWNEALELLRAFYLDGTLIVDQFRWNDPYNDYAYPAESITPEMWITTLSTGERRWKSYDGGKTFFYTTYEVAPAVWLDPSVRKTPQGQRLMTLLNVQPDVLKRIWLLETARVASGADLADRQDAPRPTLKLRMRSLYNVLNYFSYGVRVPPEDEAEGRATDLSTFRDAVARGETRDVTEHLVVRFSKDAPDSAYQAVRYRGLWFYVDDRDTTSKAGFNALYDLWQLSIASPSSESQPLTTIQVN